MSLLNNGKLAGVVGKALGSSKVLGEPVTLHIRQPGLDLDGVPSGIFTDAAAVGTPTDYSEWKRDAAGIPATDARLVIYRRGLSVSPRPGDRVTMRARVYEIIVAPADPAGATYDAQIRPVS